MKNNTQLAFLGVLLLPFFSLPAAEPAEPAIKDAWIRSDRWPDSRTPETFAKDILRLDANRIKTEEDKALAVYRWMTRCYGRSADPYEGPKTLGGEFFDPWKDFHVYGQGLCERNAALGRVVTQGIGLKAREINLLSHGMYEAFYKDTDGVERWHLLDFHVGVYVYSRDKGHIMGVDELAKEPDLWFNYTKGPTPFTCRAKEPVPPREATAEELKDKRRWFSSRFIQHDWPCNYSPLIQLTQGTSYTRYWERSPGFSYYESLLNGQNTSHKFNENHCPLGLHDPTNPYYADGSVKDPENLPYWKPYLINCESCGTKNARPTGHAVSIYRPPLWGDKFGKEAWLAADLVSEVKDNVPVVHPAKKEQLAILAYKITSPHIITDATVKAKVWHRQAQHSRDFSFWFSVNNGVSWHQIWDSENRTKEGPYDVEVNFGKEPFEKNEPTVTGMYEYLFKIDMKNFSDPTAVGIDDLVFETKSQLNMFTLPFLQPGKNKITVEAGAVRDNTPVTVTYCWDDSSGKNKTITKQLKKLPAEFEVDVQGKKPDDVHMHYVKMEVDGAPPVPARKLPEPPENIVAKLTTADRQVNVPRFQKGTPKIDGNIDPAEWQGSGVSKMRDNKTGQPVEGDFETTSYVGRDAENLYVAFDCSSNDEMVAESIHVDRDDDAWNDPSIELFITPSGKKNEYWRLVVNDLGTFFDEYHDSPPYKARERVNGKKVASIWSIGDKSQDVSAKIRASKRENNWCVEMAIPLKDLGVNLDADFIQANFYRNIPPRIRTSAKMLQEQALSPTGHGYHDVTRFGKLVLQKADSKYVVNEKDDVGNADAGANTPSAYLSTSKKVQLPFLSEKNVPIIDGAINPRTSAGPPSGEWQLQAMSLYLRDNATGKMVQDDNRTITYLGRDKEKLYLGFECFVKRKSASEAEEPEKEKREIELFICPTGKENVYWRIVIADGGKMTHEYHSSPSKVDEGKRLSAEIKTSRNKMGWELEMAIPLKDLEIDPKAEFIGANVYRSVSTQVEDKTVRQEQAMSPTGQRSNPPSQFGHLILAPQASNTQ